MGQKRQAIEELAVDLSKLALRQEAFEFRRQLQQSVTTDPCHQDLHVLHNGAARARTAASRPQSASAVGSPPRRATAARPQSASAVWSPSRRATASRPQSASVAGSPSRRATTPPPQSTSAAGLLSRRGTTPPPGSPSAAPSRASGAVGARANAARPASLNTSSRTAPTATLHTPISDATTATYDGNLMDSPQSSASTSWVSLAPFAGPEHVAGGPRTPGKNCLAEQARPEQQLMLAREGGVRPVFSMSKLAEGPRSEGPRWLSASPARTAEDYGRTVPTVTIEGEFLAWAQAESRWQPLISAFHDSQRYKPMVNGEAMRPRIERAEFKKTLAMMRFKGEGDADLIFDVIVGDRQADARGGGEFMYLSDLRRYKDRQAPRAMELLTGGGSAVDILVGALQKRRGTLLRGWRMDLDKSGLGKVAFASFTAACRKYDLGEHCKGMWKTLCPTGGMLLFSDLAPQEADNIEGFIDAAGRSTGYDLGKAWEFIDACRWNSVGVDDFERGAQDMGFDGDCRLLFDGLEVEGTRRVTREDLVYLENLSQNPALAARRKLKNNTGALTDLISWVQSEGGGAESFVAQLGQRKISLSELEAHLAARGFPFAARQAAIQVARNEPGGDGQNISASSLLAVLKGKEVSWKPRSPSRPRPQPRPPAAGGGGWDDSVNDISKENLGRCPLSKGLFGALGQESKRALFVPGAVVGYLGKQYRLVEQHQPQYSTPDRAWLVEDEHGVEKVLKESAMVVVGGDSFKPPPRRGASAPRVSNRVEVVRPSWDGTLDLSSTNNGRLPAGCRKYFSDTNDRTAKDAIRNEMRQSQVVVCVSQARSKSRQATDAVRPEEHAAPGPSSPRAGAFPDVRSDEQVYGFVASPRSSRRSRR